MNKNLSRGMSHATRAARKPIPFVEPPPLTVEQFTAIRLAEEAASREEIRKLRVGWAEHDAKVRAASLTGEGK